MITVCYINYKLFFIGQATKNFFSNTKRCVKMLFDVLGTHKR